MVNQLGINCTPIRNNVPSFGRKSKNDEQKALVKKDVAIDFGRKTSMKNCANQYWDGVVSPIKELISHPLVLGAAVATGLAVNKFAGKYKATIGLFSIASTVGLAGWNAAKGAYSLITAKTPQKREESFYDLGQATSFGVLASIPAPKVAKGNNIPGAENMNSFNALKACIKHIPTKISQIFNALKNGENIGEAMSAGIASTGAEAFSDHHHQILDLPDGPTFKHESKKEHFFSKMKDAAPEQVKSTLALVDYLKNDETGGLVVTAKATGIDGQLNKALQVADDYNNYEVINDADDYDIKEAV